MSSRATSPVFRNTALALGAASVLAIGLGLACESTRGGAKSTAGSAAVGSGAALHLDAATFERIKAQPKPVLVDFWASWCGPCRTQGPILEKVAARVGDKAVVGKVNVDEEKDLARSFDIRSIPTLVILKDGKEVQRFVGVQQEEALTAALESAR